MVGEALPADPEPLGTAVAAVDGRADVAGVPDAPAAAIGVAT